MGNYEQLKSEVSNVIKTNGTQSITGQIMQNVLLTIISTIGENATFAGIAEPTTIPGTPDGNLFYIAYEKGIYANFNSIDITDDDGLVILLYSDNWYKINIPLASKDELALLRSDLNNINTDDIKSKLGNKYIAETKTASDMQGIYWNSTDNAIKSSSNLLSLILPYPPGCVFNYTITQGTMLSIRTFSSYPKIGNSDIISTIGNGSKNETTNMQYILFQFWKRDTDASPIVDIVLSSCGVLANKKISLLCNQNKESRHISISELGSLPTDGISIVIPAGIIISTNGNNNYQPTSNITISKTGGYIYYLYLKYDNTFFISTTPSKELDYRSSLIAIISPKQNIPVSGLNCYKYNNVLYEPYSDNYLAKKILQFILTNNTL